MREDVVKEWMDKSDERNSGKIKTMVVYRERITGCYWLIKYPAAQCLLYKVKSDWFSFSYNSGPALPPPIARFVSLPADLKYYYFHIFYIFLFYKKRKKYIKVKFTRIC